MTIVDKVALSVLLNTDVFLITESITASECLIQPFTQHLTPFPSAVRVLLPLNLIQPNRVKTPAVICVRPMTMRMGIQLQALMQPDTLAKRSATLALSTWIPT